MSLWWPEILHNYWQNALQWLFSHNLLDPRLKLRQKPQALVLTKNRLFGCGISFLCYPYVITSWRIIHHLTFLRNIFLHICDVLFNTSAHLDMTSFNSVFRFSIQDSGSGFRDSGFRFIQVQDSGFRSSGSGLFKGK